MYTTVGGGHGGRHQLGSLHPRPVGIIYASAVALGFASFENFLHLEHLDGHELYARAICSPLVHVVFASVWGHACARARLSGARLLWPALGALLVAIFAHGVYDFLATNVTLGATSALVILALWIWRMIIIRRLQLAEERVARGNIRSGLSSPGADCDTLS